MIYLWMVAGFFIGHIGLDVLASFGGDKFPLLANIIIGLVGALTAYTVMT